MRTRKHRRIDHLATARGLAKRLMRTRRERTAERQLMGLSDYTLRDIGISRTDIPFIALGIPPRME